jgi:hypothetical protein
MTHADARQISLDFESAPVCRADRVWHPSTAYVAEEWPVWLKAQPGLWDCAAKKYPMYPPTVEIRSTLFNNERGG